MNWELGVEGKVATSSTVQYSEHSKGWTDRSIDRHRQLRLAHVDVRGQFEGCTARPVPLGWTCIRTPPENDPTARRSLIIRTLFCTELVWNDRVKPCCELDQTLKRF